MAILAISREYGSGGREIGRRVAERLGYQFIDKERLFRDLDAAGGRWGRLAREVDEVCPTLWERHDWQYRGYVAQLEALILTYAASDNVVLIGRGSPFLLQSVPYCLKVRVVAPLEARIERIILRESLDQEGAARLIERVDRERACYIKANYGVDWDLEKFYDLTLNTGALTYSQVIDILVPALADKDRLATPAARAHVQDLALAYRVKARIACDPRLLVPTLKVELEGGMVVVSGIIHTPKDEKLLKEIAREACGDRPVRFALHRRV
uniref:BON domain-containing protein n=1 Tax=Desulfobacca acetoxidans TaxID=60893 RepID=A0A7C3ZAL5_9BACT